MADPLETTGLDHVVLQCRDVSASRAFYEDVLGMEAIHESEAYIFLKCGHQTVALFRRNRGLPSKRMELDHVAFTVRQGFDETLKRLEAHGLGVETRPGDPRCIYFDDPDGHRIQILATA